MIEDFSFNGISHACEECTMAWNIYRDRNPDVKADPGYDQDHVPDLRSKSQSAATIQPVFQGSNGYTGT